MELTTWDFMTFLEICRNTTDNDVIDWPDTDTDSGGDGDEDELE